MLLSDIMHADAGYKLCCKRCNCKCVDNSDCKCAAYLCSQGRMALLLGPPGGGKTTLLNALAGKLRPLNGLRVCTKLTGVLEVPSCMAELLHQQMCCAHAQFCWQIGTSWKLWSCGP